MWYDGAHASTALCPPLTADEQAALEVGLHSDVGFTVRRCHMLLASAAGQTTTTIARTLHCNEQTVRNAIHSFNARGLAALTPGSSRPHTDPTIFNAARREQLRALLHQSPRTFGKPTSVWTLQLAAELSFAEGITPTLVSDAGPSHLNLHHRAESEGSTYETGGSLSGRPALGRP